MVSNHLKTVLILQTNIMLFILPQKWLFTKVTVKRDRQRKKRRKEYITIYTCQFGSLDSVPVVSD